ncbi:ABC transporter permease [Streptomyces enissocaesilis]|uniref:ABC transporter permease n=1 Tax=Streptomyces enissocaesilis TaxID=332589 RepID=UPI0031D635F9
MSATPLAAVSLLIGRVVRSGWLRLVFLALMYAVTGHAAGRRVTPNGTWWWAAVPIGAGAVPVVAALLLTGLVPVDGIALVPVAGLLVGGTSTPTVPDGRRAAGGGRRALAVRRGEVEAGPALGPVDREARPGIARPAASDALLPGLHQTGTVGLVTLRGASAGMLLGGASPLPAGVVRLFVPVALMAAQAVAVAAARKPVARGRPHRDRGA